MPKYMIETIIAPIIKNKCGNLANSIVKHNLSN